jgi:hypothetical protein
MITLTSMPMHIAEARAIAARANAWAEHGTDRELRERRYVVIRLLELAERKADSWARTNPDEVPLSDTHYVDAELTSLARKLDVELLHAGFPAFDGWRAKAVDAGLLRARYCNKPTRSGRSLFICLPGSACLYRPDTGETFNHAGRRGDLLARIAPTVWAWYIDPR